LQKRAADSRARALAPMVEEMRAAGFNSCRSIALLGVCAACSNKPAAAPPAASDPKSADSVPAKPTPATVPNVKPNANTTPVWSPSTNSGYAVFNQYDPPMRVPISR